MSLEKITRPYETLIRHDNDGIGAHHCTITEIVDTDDNNKVINAQVNPPVQLSVADGENELSWAGILGETAKTVLLENEQLKAELKMLQDQLKSLQRDET